MNAFSTISTEKDSTKPIPDWLKSPSLAHDWLHITPSQQEESVSQPPSIPVEFAVTEQPDQPVISTMKNRYPLEHNLQYVAPSPISPQLDLCTVHADNTVVSSLFLPAVLESASFIFSPVDESGHLLCFVFRRQDGNCSSICLTVKEFYKRDSLVQKLCLSGLSPLPKMTNTRKDELIKAFVCSQLFYYNAVTLPGWHRTPLQSWAYALPEENNPLIQQPLKNKVLNTNRPLSPKKMREFIEAQNGYLKNHSKLALLHLFQTAAIYQSIFEWYGLKWDKLVYIVVPYLDNRIEQFFQSLFSFYQNHGLIPLPVSKKELLNYIEEANDQVLLFQINKIPQGQYAQKLLEDNINTIHRQMGQPVRQHSDLKNHYLPVILSKGPYDRISPDEQILFALEEAELGTSTMPFPPMAAGQLLAHISFFERNKDNIEGIIKFVMQNSCYTGIYSTCHLILETSRRINILWYHMHNPAHMPEIGDSLMTEWLDSFFTDQEEALDSYAVADYFISILKEWMIAGKISVIESFVPYPKGRGMTAIHRGDFVYFKRATLQTILKKLNIYGNHLPLFRELELQGFLFTDSNSGRKTYDRKMYYTQPDGSACYQERFYVFKTERLFAGGEPKPF